MHLVSTRTQATDTVSSFAGLAFSLAIADADAVQALREAGHGRVTLAAPYHMSDDDAYLIVPDDIGLEVIDILRDGDHELLHETLRDGLLALGHLERGDDGMELHVERCQSPQSVLAAGLPYAARLELDGEDLERRINQLGHLQCTTLSACVSDDGLEQMLREEEFVGVSWSLDPDLVKRLGNVDPTFVWSRRQGHDAVNVELVVFTEDDEIVALLRPLQIAL